MHVQINHDKKDYPISLYPYIPISLYPYIPISHIPISGHQLYMNPVHVFIAILISLPVSYVLA